MNKINTIIYGKAKIISMGIKAILKNNELVDVIDCIDNAPDILNRCISKQVNLILMIIDTNINEYLEIIKNIHVQYSHIRVLVISIDYSDEIIYKTIKAGAKGFLNKDCNEEELMEAILTIRNGYDYYSKSISRIVINNYIHKLDEQPQQGKELLSNREIEVLKLWGESNTNKEIAEKLCLSVRTVETHKNRIMQKINLKTSVDLIKFAIKNDIIKL